MPGCTKLFVQKKYKKFIDLLFPKNPGEGIVMKNAKKFTEYCLNNTNKLTKIGKYLENRVVRDLNGKRYGFVGIAMKATIVLIQACHSDTEMNLFGQSVIRMIEELIRRPDEQLRIWAVETLVTFAYYQGEAAPHRKLDDFMTVLIDLGLDESTLPTTQRRLRMAGLLGILTMIEKTMISAGQMSRLMPVLLNNMQYPREHDVPNSPEVSALALPSGQLDFSNIDNIFSGGVESVRGLAYRSFVLLFQQTNLATIRGLLDSVFEYLDKADRWLTRFATECLQVAVISVQTQHGYVLFSYLLQHLERTTASTRIKAGIVRVATSIIGSFKGSLGPALLSRNSLLRPLVSSVQGFAASNSEEAAAQEELKQSLIECIGLFAEKLGSWSECVDMLTFIMAKLPQPARNDPDPKEDRQVVLRCGLHLIQCHRRSRRNEAFDSVDLPFPNAILDVILLASRAADPESRLLSQKILQELLSPVMQPRFAAARSGSFTHTSNVHSLLSISRLQKPFIHSSLFKSLGLTNNTPELYVSYFNTFAVLLDHYGIKEAISALPLMFRAQDLASDDSMPIAISASIHALVLAYLLVVSSRFAAPILKEHLRKVLAQRREANQIPRSLDITEDGLKLGKVPSDVGISTTKAAKIDRTFVVDALCKIPAFTQERLDLRDALLKPYVADTRKPYSSNALTQLQTSLDLKTEDIRLVPRTDSLDITQKVTSTTGVNTVPNGPDLKGRVQLRKSLSLSTRDKPFSKLVQDQTAKVRNAQEDYIQMMLVVSDTIAPAASQTSISSQATPVDQSEDAKPPLTDPNPAPAPSEAKTTKAVPVKPSTTDILRSVLMGTPQTAAAGS